MLRRAEVSRSRILVVDDDCNALEALGELLREEGFDTRIALDGADALAQVGAFRPDVVLSDVRMPGMTGVALRDHLRASGSAARVILMSAYSRRDAGAEDAEPFLSKPLDVDTLIALIRRLLPGHADN